MSSWRVISPRSLSSKISLWGCKRFLWKFSPLGPGPPSSPSSSSSSSPSWSYSSSSGPVAFNLKVRHQVIPPLSSLQKWCSSSHTWLSREMSMDSPSQPSLSDEVSGDGVHFCLRFWFTNSLRGHIPCIVPTSASQDRHGNQQTLLLSNQVQTCEVVLLPWSLVVCSSQEHRKVSVSLQILIHEVCTKHWPRHHWALRWVDGIRSGLLFSRNMVVIVKLLAGKLRWRSGWIGSFFWAMELV